MHKTVDAIDDSLRHQISVFGKNFAIQVQEARFNDRCGRFGVDLIESVVIGHIVGDRIGMERQARPRVIPINHTRSQPGSLFWISAMHGRRHFEASGFVINISAGIIVDGDQRN
jgi:hypothetical protein